MNPINIICANCESDNLVEPEVAEDDEAICPSCKGSLHYHDCGEIIENCTHVFDNHWQCNDCGAHAQDDHKNIKHYGSCVPGESVKWEKYYAKAE
jgi:C4-type Zn-finger protein